MTNFAPDTGLDNFLGGKYAQGASGSAPMWARHPTVSVSIAPPEDPGVEAGVATGLYDAATNQPVYAVLDDGGVVIEKFYFDPITGAKTVTTTGFSAAAAPAPKTELAYDTLMSGVVERINKVTSFDANGVPQAPTYVRYTDNAVYAPAGVVAPLPSKVQMGSEDSTVTGTAGVALTVPTAMNSDGINFPQHALIHVQVDSSDTATGIAYTTDGAAPSEAHEFERSEGQPITLDTHEELSNFLAVPLNGQGDIDGAASIQITVEYNNISPDKDEF